MVEECLKLSQDVQPRVETDPATRNRYLRVKALAGPLKLAFGATVDLSYHVAEPAQIGEVPVAHLPAQVPELHLPEPPLSIGPPAQTRDARVRPAVFGTVTSPAPRIVIEAIAGADGRLVTPRHCTEALSTDG